MTDTCKKNNKPLFLVRPTPEISEYVPEYLQRLGKANGLVTLSQILEVLGVPLSHIIASGQLQLQKVIRGEAPIDSLKFNRHQADACGMYFNKLSGFTFARVCVSCLKESDVLSADWSYPLSVTCRKHQHQLLDHCSYCKRPIVRKESHYKCKCGLAFIDQEPQPAPIWENRFYELFAPWRLLARGSHSDAEILRHEYRSAQALRHAISTSGYPSTPPNPNVKNWIFSSDYGFIENICRPDFSLSTLVSYAPAKLKRLWWRHIRFKVRHLNFTANNEDSRIGSA